MISRTRISLASVGAMLMLVASVGAASAQGRRGGGFFGMMGGRGGGGLMLLRNQSVQEELKMTQPQIAKVDTKQQELRQSMQELFQSGQNGQNDPEARRTMMTKMQQMQEKAVADILDNAQLHRFHQVQLQIEGPSAIARKEVADQLALTTDQRAQVQKIQQAEREQMRSQMQGVDFRNMSPSDRQQMMEKMQALRKGFEAQYAAVLTSSQKAQWKHMIGAPFKLVMPQGPPPGQQS